MTDLYSDVYHDTYGAAMPLTLGVDTSSYQGTVNWAKVAQTPYRFAVVRMSIGRGTRDTQGRTALKAALDSLPVAGGYGVVGVSEPVEDGAKLLLDEIATITDPKRVLVMLDAENFNDGSHPTIDQVNRYAIALHDRLGRWPVAYVPGWWLAQHGYGVAGKPLSNCPWAPSRYISTPWTEVRLLANKPSDLKGFKSLAWLQYTSSASVAGVVGNCDANVHYGSLTDLKARLLGQEDSMSAEDVAAIKAHIDKRVGTDTRSVDQLIGIMVHGDDDPRRNSLDSIAETLKAGLNVSLADATPQQLQDLGNAIADRLALNGVGYTLTGELVPKPPAP